MSYTARAHLRCPERILQSRPDIPDAKVWDIFHKKIQDYRLDTQQQYVRSGLLSSATILAMLKTCDFFYEGRGGGWADYSLIFPLFVEGVKV